MSGDDSSGLSPVSVVVPAYNAESTIDGAVQSLLRQEYPRDCFEVIVVENGSRDRTQTLLTRYGRTSGSCMRRNRGRPRPAMRASAWPPSLISPSRMPTAFRIQAGCASSWLTQVAIRGAILF